MSDKKVVLVTGVAGYWGGQVAKQLASNPTYHVIGLDRESPGKEIENLDFIPADIRNPLLVDLLRSERVDTLCHLAFIESDHPTEMAFDTNVTGTVKVFNACAEAGVRKIVFKSSATVYGANPNNPSFLTEEHTLRGSRVYGYNRDLLEIESFCNSFQRQYPDLMLTVLRFSNIVGLSADTPLTRYLHDTLAPVLLGFDPMMQAIHEQDVVDALVYAIVNDVAGIFNVAAEGVMSLSRLIGLAGKLPVPVLHWFAYWGVGVFRGIRLQVNDHMPIELDYIRYPWVCDLKKMHEVFGFTTGYTAEEALQEFASMKRVRRNMPEAAVLAYDEDRLRKIMERRDRAREQSGIWVEKVEETIHE